MPSCFFIRSGSKYVKLNFHDIHYVEARKNYVRIVTPHKYYVVLISMKQMEKVLPQQLFCRVHRSFIVSLNSITAFDHEQVYLDDKSIPLGEQYKSILWCKVMIVINEVRDARKYNIPLEKYSS